MPCVPKRVGIKVEGYGIGKKEKMVTWDKKIDITCYFCSALLKLKMIRTSGKDKVKDIYIYMHIKKIKFTCDSFRAIYVLLMGVGRRHDERNDGIR